MLGSGFGGGLERNETWGLGNGYGNGAEGLAQRVWSSSPRVVSGLGVGSLGEVA